MPSIDRRIRPVFVLVPALVAALASGAVVAVEVQDPAAHDDRAAYPGPAVTEAQVLELGRPGPEHRALEPMVGSWTGQVTYWPYPEAAPVTQEATAEKSWILGGRFLRIEFRSTIGEEPFEGLALVGYDRTAERYVSTWMDSLTTGVLHLQGARAKDGTLVTEGERIEPTTGKSYRVRRVTAFDGEDAHVVSFFDELDDGTMFKSLEIRWTRVAP